MKISRYDECDECGVKGNVSPLEFLNDKLLCEICWNEADYTCSICNEIKVDVSERRNFDNKRMCDFCYDEECHNALASEFNESRRP